MSIQEQLKLGDKVFSKIDKLVKEEQFDEIYDVIEASEPPSSWIIELPSKARPGETFKALPLDIMEACVTRIFGHKGQIKIRDYRIDQDKNGRFAATVSVEYFCRMHNADESSKFLYGIATVPCNDITLLELATPKASSMAVKNALKQLGGLFGKYLNKTVEEAEVLEPTEVKLTPEEFTFQFTKQLISCKSYDELKSYRLVVYDKKTSNEIRDLYENRLRELAKTAKSIG